MFITSIVVYIILRKVTANGDIEENASGGIRAGMKPIDEEGNYTHKQLIILKRIGKLKHFDQKGPFGNLNFKSIL